MPLPVPLSPTGPVERGRNPSRSQTATPASRFFFLAAMVLAVGVFLLSLGAVVKMPTPTGWKMAVVATQFGHWIALGAALLFVVSIRRSERQARRGWRVTAGLSGTAAVLLLVPAGRAWW